MADDANTIGCRWGIMSTAHICNKNVGAIKKLPKEVAQVVAVASRSLERAQEFAKTYDIPKAYGSYQELLDDPEVDAVYIPIPTAVRKEWVLKAAAAGKHILVEKPAGVNAAEVRELIEAAKTHKVELMDGVMFMHHPRLNEIRKTIDANEIGEVLSVTSAFNFYGSDDFNQSNIRVQKNTEPLGALGDLGWYNTRFSLFVFNYALPVEVEGRFHKVTSEGVPLDVSAILYFDKEHSKRAHFQCSFLQGFQQWAVISGASATIHLHDFVLPSNVIMEHEFVVNKGRMVEAVTLKTKECTQEVEMWRTFSNAVIARRKGEEGLHSFWTEVTLKTQLVLDAIVESATNGGKVVPIQN